MENVLLMMKALTTTAMMAKARSTDEMMEMNWSKSLLSSAILVAAVTTSSSASAKAARWSRCSSGTAASIARNSMVACSRRRPISAMTVASSAPSSSAMAISV